MKKAIVVAATVALTATLAGCAAPAASSSSAESAASETAALSAEASDSTASSAAASSESAASSTAVQTVNWTKVGTAQDAAKGAGFKTFGVMTTIEANGMTFKTPAFSYADGVAQAFYEQGAAAIDMRKAEGSHNTPLTDRDKTEFANAWSTSIEGLDVSCFGATKDTATVITWTDGTKEYGVTFQGLGGEELALTTDEITAIVKGVKEADGDKKEAEEPSSSSAAAEDADNNDADVPQFDVEQAIFNAGLGEFISYARVQDDDGDWVWQVVTRGSDGNEYTSYLDDAGNVIQGGADTNDDEADNSDMTWDDAEQIVFDNGLGELVSYEHVQGEDGGWYYRIVTRGADGGEATSYADANGNIVQGGVEESEEQSDIEEAVFNNGLGQLDSYETVQGTDGNTYTRVVTRGADGGEYTSYLDENGNVVEGGIEEA